MNKVTVEYFGPAKTYTANRHQDVFQVRSSNLAEVLLALYTKYGLQFLNYVITACGIAIDEEYTQLDQRPTLAPEDDIASSVRQLFSTYTFAPGAEIVIVPPVSAG